MKTELSVKYPKDAKRDLRSRKCASGIIFTLNWRGTPTRMSTHLLKDWCRTAYGPGADAIYAYHRAMAEAWDGMKIHLTYFGTNPGGASGISSTRTHHIRQDKVQRGAGSGGEEPDPELRKRYLGEIELETAFFDSWEKTFQLASENSSAVALHSSERNDEFARLGMFPMQSRKGTHLSTETRICWTPRPFIFRRSARNPK